MKQRDDIQNSREDSDALRAALPYIAPYAVFMLFTVAADYLPQWRSLIYILKIAVTTATLWRYRSSYTELRLSFRAAAVIAVLVGPLVIAFWVGFDPYYPQSSQEWRSLLTDGFQRFEHVGKTEGQFDPFTSGQVVPPLLAILFRIIGAVLVVPVFEELLFRSWVMRFFIKNDFRSVSVGTFTWSSFVISTLAFGLMHHEWLAGIMCGVAFGLILYWKRDLMLCVVAHASTNAALAAWVIIHQDWAFW